MAQWAGNLAFSGPVEIGGSAGEPQLSIVLPVYRVESFLRPCLDSILAENVDAGIEVVAVNDASPDGSAGILDDYSQLDSRLRVVHLGANHGTGYARNVGLDRARGKYVWFFDPDDCLPQGALRLILGRLAAVEPDLLIVDHAEAYSNGVVSVQGTADLLQGAPSPLRLADRPQLLRMAPTACTKIVRRAFLHDLGLRFRSGWYEDSAFSIPLLMAAGRIDVLGEVCYIYRRLIPGSVTSTVSSKHFDVFTQYERIFALVEEKSGEYDTFRPELFRAMINHYFVILGNPWRLPDDLRREFFQQARGHYLRWLPTGHYPVPHGLDGFKHRLLKRNSYWLYIALRWVYRVVNVPLRQL